MEESRNKANFLSVISHELRTPLNTIMGFTCLLQDSSCGELNEKQREFVGHIQKSSTELLELINHTIEWYKKTALNDITAQEQETSIKDFMDFLQTLKQERVNRTDLREELERLCSDERENFNR